MSKNRGQAPGSQPARGHVARQTNPTIVTNRLRADAHLQTMSGKPHQYLGGTAMRRTVLVLSTTLLLASQACSATTGNSSPPAAAHSLHAVTGTVTVYDGKAFPAKTGPCTGSGNGYDDLATGTQVTVKNQAGALVGVGTFGDGKLTGRGGCILSFTVPDVKPADFYQLSTGTGRPPHAVSAIDLAADSWKMDLSVGDAARAAIDSGADCVDPKLFTTTVSETQFGQPRRRDGQSPVTATLTVTNRGDQDADVLVDWGVKAWSGLMHSYEDVVMEVATVHNVPAGQTVRTRVRGATLVVSGFESDFGNVKTTAHTYEAMLAGKKAVCPMR